MKIPKIISPASQALHSLNKLKLKPTVINNQSKEFLTKNALLGLAVLGASSLLTSCNSDNIDETDIYIPQCSEIKAPIKSLEGLETKTDYLMKLVKLLPENASISDVKQINIEKTNGDKIVLKPTEKTDNEIIMEYTLTKQNGNSYYSTMSIMDSQYGQIRTQVIPKGAITSSYSVYTQSTANFDNVHVTTMQDSKTTKAIIKKYPNGIEKINQDNSKEFIRINVEL